ncbi:DUF6777 domain-containing protein [Actinomadura hibisca]|uniref:DUF6777 domain-containing protein n=1 Tax=Actinomadura hibisca TaxID=68565 RepID=UPI00082C89BC|nr:DUF6777 domain-containing protein [Actinomadura hibisca]
MALVMIAATLTGCREAGATIARLTVGAPGPDPYTVMLGSDSQGIRPSPQAGGARPGDQPGLYGGTRRTKGCDPQRLIAFLQANPDKARAWASVHRIEPAGIAGFVTKLTPVLLRTDTLVTNHGYREGRATSAPAVLQAGMGVMVDQFGAPLVKCNCGNPLTAPDKKISVRESSYSGPSWEGFSERKVTVILPRDSDKGPISTFVLVAPDGTTGFSRPAATTGESDGPETPPPPTESAAPGGSPSGVSGPSESPPASEPVAPGTEPPPSQSAVPSEAPPPSAPASGEPTTGGGGAANPEPQPVAPSEPAADPVTPEPNGEASPPQPVSLAPPRPERPTST